MEAQNKNIRLTKTTIVNEYGKTLYQIEAIHDFMIGDNADEGKAGKLGGFVESITQLKDNTWVYEGAQLFGNAVLTGHSYIDGNAIVMGDVVVRNSEIHDHCIVDGGGEIVNTVITGNSVLKLKPKNNGNNAKIIDCCMSDHVHISGLVFLRNSTFERLVNISDSYIDSSFLNSGHYRNAALSQAKSQSFSWVG